ncbi:MAG: DUF3209 family protein [Spirochaetia bacterium]|nr:DUF3209 family protein [Spirochaetia bacterium]
MACKELSALRLGLMDLIGIDDPAEKEHDKKDLGESAVQAGVIRSITESRNLSKLMNFYAHAVVDLHEKVSGMEKEDESYAYHQALLVLTKKVEQDLSNQVEGLKKLYQDLDEIHHFLHDIYPANGKK